MISCFRIESQTATAKWFKMHRSKVKKPFVLNNNSEGISVVESESDLDSESSYSKMLRSEASKQIATTCSLTNANSAAASAVAAIATKPRNGAKLKSEIDNNNMKRTIVDLPDGFCFSRSMQINANDETSMRECKYIGSFVITGDNQESRAQFVKDQLRKFQNKKGGKQVLLVVSQTGIKVCSPKTKSVLMAHALRRISYATCDLPQNYFSFLAREPRGHFSLQYCHAFATQTPQQAEELSRLVGEVFRMAFAQQLQQQTPTTSFLDLVCHPSTGHGANASSSPSRGLPLVNGSLVNVNGVVNSRLDHCPTSPGPSRIIPHHHHHQQHHQSPSGGTTTESAGSPKAFKPGSASEVNWRSPSVASCSTEEMNGNLFPQSPSRAAEVFRTTVKERVWAKTVVSKHHDPLSDRGAIRMSPLSPQRGAAPPVSLPTGGASGAGAMTPPDLWSPSSTSSCEDNTGHLGGHLGGLLGSPTEVNSCLQFKEKPQMVKNFESSWTTVTLECPPISTTNATTSSSGTMVNSAATEMVIEEELVRPGSGGYVNENPTRNEDLELEAKFRLLHRQQVALPSPIATPPMSPSRPSSTADSLLDCKRASQSSTANSESCSSLNSDDTNKSDVAGGGGGGARQSSSSGRSVVTPPPIPERHDSLSSQEEEEERELRDAPWFQAGIPREIALEILAQEPVGSFMVRESTSKPGCYALSLRVPRDFQPTGIAHYLIMRTQRGFKIKGFMKEFSTLTALITHHSVMPELLPCPLSLSRYNPVFRKQDTSEDLVDIEDPDYNLLADFRKVMADLKV